MPSTILPLSRKDCCSLADSGAPVKRLVRFFRGERTGDFEGQKLSCSPKMVVKKKKERYTVLATFPARFSVFFQRAQLVSMGGLCVPETIHGTSVIRVPTVASIPLIVALAQTDVDWKRRLRLRGSGAPFLCRT